MAGVGTTITDNPIEKEVLERLKHPRIQQLIEDSRWLELYEDFYEYGGTAVLSCGVLTSLLMNAGINPLASLTDIPPYFFINHDELTSFKLPDQIDTIGDYAFGSCRHLEEIVFNNSLTTIGSASFYECLSLKILNLPDSVSAVGHYAFSNCLKLEEITFGCGLQYVGRNICSLCGALYKITYRGTRSGWKKVMVDEDNKRLLAVPIYCTDGVLKWDKQSGEWIEI